MRFDDLGPRDLLPQGLHHHDELHLHHQLVEAMMTIPLMTKILRQSMMEALTPA
jgi:hypothetical protein